MATPTYPSRRYYAAGTKRCTSTWGTAVALGALDQVLMKGDSGLALAQAYEQYPACDMIMGMDGSLSLNGPSEFAPPIDLQYEMGAWGRWLAAIFGTAGAPVIQGAGPAYLHTFQWADSVTHFFTYVEERPGKIWEVPSAMPYKFNAKSAGSKIDAAIALRGNKMIDTSAVNTATQIDALTPASRSGFVSFTHGKFLMNAQAGAELADPGDKIIISDFDLNLQRSIDGVMVAGSDYIAEPKEGAFPDNILNITIPHAGATDLAYLTTFLAMTPQKGKLSFTGALITGSYYYTISFYFPQLRFGGPPDVKLEDIIKNGLNFKIEAASAAPNGMTYARPYATVINIQTTDYLV